jgi:sulfur-oxidizing protein SoxY
MSPTRAVQAWNLVWRPWLSCLLLVLSWQLTGPSVMAAPATAVDPYDSLPWADLQREYLGGGRVEFDRRVEVQGPGFAEDPMNVPVTIRVDPALGPVRQIMVLVDRNPIRRVLVYQPLLTLPVISFRFKLEQASPVRAAVQTADGQWHVGSTWVESAGGGCTVSGASRKDGSWSRTLGDVSARLFSAAPEQSLPAARLRLRVMHPMDTGLVGGVPAFFVNRLVLRDAAEREWARLQVFEPVSENPVFSFDFAKAPPGPLRIVGVDNNGNRIDSLVD